jgi:hypothetical protein
MAAASDIAMPNPARALMRALSGNSDVASAGVQASASAVPTPWPARAHRNNGQSGAAAQAAHPSEEISRPMRKIRRWPNRSPSLPHTSISEP